MKDKNAVNVYLYGIQGVYNYGCEAMIRSISESIHSIVPNSTVVYKTYDLENDSKALSNCGFVSLESIQVVKRAFLLRLLRFAKRHLGIARPEDFLSIDTSWARNCDLLIIIGGDVFDLTPNQRKKRVYDNDRVFVSQIVKKSGGKVVLWGISVGDFDCNAFAKKKLLFFFKRIVDFAIIRDEKSLLYLNSNNVDNAKLFSDPAFIQRTIQTSSERKSILGINLSPLSNKYLLSKDQDSNRWISAWADYITGLFKELDYGLIYLIPHVVNPRMHNDDDSSYLKRIRNALEERNVPAVLVPDDLGFLSIKPYLCECDMVMAARMHCAVNAITCGVPTVFLSYSPKSVGMCKHVYGDEKMVLDMNKMISECEYSKVKAISKETDRIRDFLRIRNLELFEDAQKAAKALVQTIGI